MVWKASDTTYILILISIKQLKLVSSYDIRPALRVDRLFQLLLATLADMAIEAIENSSWRRHLIHANRAFRSSWWLVGNVTGSEYAEFVEYAEYAKYAKFAKQT